MCEVIALKYLGCLYVEFIRNRSRIGWNESGLLYNSISWLDPSVRSLCRTIGFVYVCLYYGVPSLVAVGRRATR